MVVKSIIKLIPGFKPTPKSGTVSTIQKSASEFVKRRKQLSKKPKQTKGPAGKALKAGVAVGAGAFAAGQIAKETKKLKPVKKAMGGQASEGVARAEIRRGIRDRKRKELMDSLERLRKKSPTVKVRKKPKKSPGTIKPKSKILNMDIGRASSDQIKSAIQTLQDRLKENK